MCLDLHVWTSPTTHAKKEICIGKHVNPGALAIPLKAFGPSSALAAKYPGADLDKKVVLDFAELVACWNAVLKLHTSRQVAARELPQAQDILDVQTLFL